MKKSKQKKLSESDMKNVLTPLSDEQIDSLSMRELKILLKGEQKIRQFYEEVAEYARELNKELEDKVLCIEGTLVKLKNRLFSPKTEKSPRNKPDKNDKEKKKTPLTKERDLEKRYPNAEVIIKEVHLSTPPQCSCCQNDMSEMGVFEKSQHLTVIPKKYLITNILRMKYRCSNCQSDIKTTPQIPRIIPRSSYGDNFLIDVALSKYCDLIPVERYCEMASRQGFSGIPPQSLHEGIWRFAQFLRPIYEQVRIETLDSRILLGDETPHKMLEGHEKSNWFLWGFFSSIACFFECHESRSGDVATDILSESSCEYFLSDAYSGYSRAIVETNKLRTIAELKPIIEVLCNAHARRYFKECGDISDAEFFIEEYRKIYHTEKEVKDFLKKSCFKDAEKKRLETQEYFESMKIKAEKDLDSYSSHHVYYKACQYFLNNFLGLTACLQDPWIPIDNNQSERGLRSSVVGRKTWYGTHSEKGAEAAVIHFTIIECCKLNGVNPRIYYKEIVDAIHYKRPILSPSQFQKINT